MPSPDPAALAREVVGALALAGQRGMLLSGWGALGGVELPKSVFALEAAPHDWLYPRVSAVVHHGGAGTTSAALRAGCRRMVVPFMADQWFWGDRVRRSAPGRAWFPRRKLDAERFGEALRDLVENPRYRDGARTSPTRSPSKTASRARSPPCRSERSASRAHTVSGAVASYRYEPSRPRTPRSSPRRDRRPRCTSARCSSRRPGRCARRTAGSTSSGCARSSTRGCTGSRATGSAWPTRRCVGARSGSTTAHFKVEYHVRHTALPRPGDAAQLKRLIGRVGAQPLDRAHPLWELWVVEGLAGGERFALISKVHHCMVDGISGAELMTVLMGARPDAIAESAPPFVPRPGPSARRARARRAARARAARRSPRAASLARAARAEKRAELGHALRARGVARCAQSLVPASRTPLNREIGPHRRFEYLALDLGRVKAIKDKLGGTLNDVVLAVVTGAMRRFLQRRAGRRRRRSTSASRRRCRCARAPRRACSATASRRGSCARRSASPTRCAGSTRSASRRAGSRSRIRRSARTCSPR